MSLSRSGQRFLLAPHASQERGKRLARHAGSLLKGSRGGTIERGILAGGIGTTLFYITIGRNGSVSDVAFMARTSSLSKTQLSLIFGGFSAVHALRISRDPAYDHLFVRPTGNGLGVGLRFLR